jgi:hypothetical protein
MGEKAETPSKFIFPQTRPFPRKKKPIPKKYRTKRKDKRKQPPAAGLRSLLILSKGPDGNPQRKLCVNGSCQRLAPIERRNK